MAPRWAAPRSCGVCPVSGSGPYSAHGDHCSFRDRYDLVPQAAVDSGFRYRDEAAVKQDGEVRWLGGKAMQEAYNHGRDGRIQLVFDLVPRAHAALAPGEMWAA